MYRQNPAKFAQEYVYTYCEEDARKRASLSNPSTHRGSLVHAPSDFDEVVIFSVECTEYPNEFVWKSKCAQGLPHVSMVE